MQPEFIKMFIAEVKEEMKSQKIDQNTLRKKAGLSLGTISETLSGKCGLSIKTASKLADGLGMKVVLCLGDIDE